MSTEKSVSIPLAFFLSFLLVANLPNSIDHKIINFVCHNSFVINSSSLSSVSLNVESMANRRNKVEHKKRSYLGNWVGRLLSLYLYQHLLPFPHFLSMVIEVMEKL